MRIKPRHQYSTAYSDLSGQQLGAKRIPNISNLDRNTAERGFPVHHCDIAGVTALTC